MHASNHTCLELSLPDEPATLALGAAFGAALQSQLGPLGDVAQSSAPPSSLVVTLEGDLGAGKTTLVRGLLRGLGYGNKVKSPTYTLVEAHAVSGLNLYHFDFYRFNDPEEYLEAGLDEYFHAQGPQAGICLVEWPDKAGDYLPPPDVRICLSVDGEGRRAELYGCSSRGIACLTRMTPPSFAS